MHRQETTDRTAPPPAAARCTVLLESMSYRLPVITSAIPACLEVGLDAECYHQVGDVDALAAKLDAIINKPLQRMDYDMSKYDWEKIADQVAEIYDNI